MRKFLIFLACLPSTSLASSRAPQADWRIVNWSDDVLLYVDHNSIQKSKSLVAYSAKIVFLKDASLSEVISQTEVRCDTRMSRNLKVSGVSKAGRTTAERASRVWRSVEAGTNVEREMQSVCMQPSAPPDPRTAARHWLRILAAPEAQFIIGRATPYYPIV
jgi:phosphoketolase